MAGHPHRLSRLWQELKRRRVINVITVYASASFAIIEIINNLTEPLNLPISLSTIVIIVLAVGFPLAIILSWLYNLTSGTFERTKPLDETKEEDKPIAVPNAWKIATYVSFVVIVGLVTVNIMSGSQKLRPGDIQSLAILPFDNFTGDDQLDWVAEGMHSSLIGDMGKVSGLRVLGETTSNTFKQTDLTATEIAQKHHVEALVEPTLTCYGDMVCIQVRVVTAYPEEKLLWVEDYMEDKSQILNLYKRIIRKIANELKVNLTQQEETALAESMTVNPEAYDAYLKGRVQLDMFNPQSFQAAIENFQKVIELEPEWAAPYAGIAEVGTYMRQFGMASESDMIFMYRNLNRALELDPNSAETHHSNAIIAVWTEFDWEKGEKEFLKAIELNPSFERSHSFYAHLLSILRRTDEALYQGKIAVEIEPENPFTLGLYAVVLRNAEKCEEALYYTEKALAIDPDHLFLRFKMQNAYFCSGNFDKVFEEMKKNNIGRWERFGVTALLEETFHERGWYAFMKQLIDLTDGIMAESFGSNLTWLLHERYFLLGRYDKAMDYLEIAYNNDRSNPELPYRSVNHIYKKLKGDPRYIEFLEKMNLPVTESD
jgi:TolB-like protein/Tfp pilus assembly protein PilF